MQTQQLVRTTASMQGSMRGMAIGARPARGTPLMVSSRPQRRVHTNAAPVQANLFARVSRIVRSYVNTVVSNAEDPEKILEQAVEDMQNDLVKMRQASAQVMASQKQIERKFEQAQTTADEWYRRAELALQKGEEDLAREALTRKKGYQDQADSFKAQLAQQKQAVDQLISNTRILESKLAEAKTKKDTLKARAASAKTSRQINEMLGNVSTGKTALEAFDRMEEKVMALEAESEAAFALLPSDSLESQFKKLEGNDVDAEMNKLKANLGAGKKPIAQLPPGRPIKDAIDFELEEMRRRSGSN